MDWHHVPWIEDEEVEIDGKSNPDLDLSNIPDAVMMTIRGGIICTPEIDISLETQIRRWRKKQMTTTLLVEVKSENIEAVKTAIVNSGGKIL